MPDDAMASSASVPTPRQTPMTRASSSGISSPVGHGLRCATTMDEASIRRRPSQPSPLTTDSPIDLPRRSSNFSDYSLHEARDILNPKHSVEKDTSQDASSLASLSLAFALLPALAGALFKDGHVVVTDILLLGLAGVFLHWSVTQPWSWYHSAQGVRVQHQGGSETIIDDDSDLESYNSPPGTDAGGHLDDVAEEDDTAKDEPTTQTSSRNQRHNARQQAALSELYLHEVLALASCFVLPLLSAYLLHGIRSQLSRPSEGLVSNYNLSIFLLVSELRAIHHTIKLVHARTLHLQRIVHANPYVSSAAVVDETQLEGLLVRLDRLESRPRAEEAHVPQATHTSTEQEAALTRDVRNAIQPELDALNRAVRRYEKKTTLLQQHTESRFGHVEARLGDAIALAAVAAKNSTSQKNVFKWAVDSMVALVLFPFNALLQLLLLPLRSVMALIYRKPPQTQPPKMRGGRNSKAGSAGRFGGDRVPSRVSRR